MENVTFETNEENKTGTICTESGTYLCTMHPYIERYIYKDDQFPACDQKGIPHNTIWGKIIKDK